MIAGRLHWFDARRGALQAGGARAPGLHERDAARSPRPARSAARRCTCAQGQDGLRRARSRRHRGARRRASSSCRAAAPREPHAEARARPIRGSSAASATRTRTRSCTRRGSRRCCSPARIDDEAVGRLYQATARTARSCGRSGCAPEAGREVSREALPPFATDMAVHGRYRLAVSGVRHAGAAHPLRRQRDQLLRPLPDRRTAARRPRAVAPAQGRLAAGAWTDSIARRKRRRARAAAAHPDGMRVQAPTTRGGNITRSWLTASSRRRCASVSMPTCSALAMPLRSMSGRRLRITPVRYS